jgi:hypothetical protein
METKKWPVLAQILIALGCINGFAGISRGLYSHGVLDIIFGIAVLVIFWNVYKFKSWALKGLVIVLVLNIIFTLLTIFQSVQPVIGIIAIAINGFIIYYFNSEKIKVLFSS